VPVPVSSEKRFAAITATIFGGPDDPNTSFYDGHFITDFEFGVALPAPFTGTRPKWQWRFACDDPAGTTAGAERSAERGIGAGQYGRRPVHIPIFLPITDWGVLGKMEKWT
jgi:hypothetical protein